MYFEHIRDILFTSSSWQQEPRSSPISLKHNEVLFPNTATTGIKYALIFTDQSTVFKLNVSFGFILGNNETGALQYCYASKNKEQVLEEPFQITTAADLQKVRDALLNLDVLEWVRQWRPNSKWVVEEVTNITFFATKLRGHPIGRGTGRCTRSVRTQDLIALAEIEITENFSPKYARYTSFESLS